MYTRRVTAQERQNADLSAELDRTKSSLSAAREATLLLRAERHLPTRANEDYATGTSMSLGAGMDDDVEYSDDPDYGGGEGEMRPSSRGAEGVSGSMNDLHRRHASAGYEGLTGSQTMGRSRQKKYQP